jgi:hypothetical protein
MAAFKYGRQVAILENQLITPEVMAEFSTGLFDKGGPQKII